MKPARSAPIPVPWPLRWREIRLRVVPALIFAFALVSIAFLWRDHVAAPSMVGQAEPILSNVGSHKAGVLAELNVGRFQRVKVGDVLGKVMIADPVILTNTIALIKAEIAALRSGMEPLIARQRSAVNYDQLRLDWMKERAQLASSRVSLEQAESEFARMEELFKDKIVAERVYDRAKGNRDRLKTEVQQLERLVAEGEANLKTLQLTNSTDFMRVSDEPLTTAIAVEESKLALAEAELSPVILHAPIDGIVTALFHRAGESVVPGRPILSVATLNPVRIVGYLRAPITDEPVRGMNVQVRTRGFRRESGLARIVEVGTQLEPLPATFASTPLKLVSPELGLPIDISMPTNLKIRAGELVDIIFLPNSKPTEEELAPTESTNTVAGKVLSGRL
jgi:multidrug resistance efflux pump